MTRPATAADAAQILANLAWIPNPPNETEDSIRQRLETPNAITVIDEPGSKAMMMGIAYPDEPGVKAIWWLGPPESHFRDLLAALSGFVEEALRQYPMSRPWRFYGDTADELLTQRWIDEVKETNGPPIVTVRTSPNNVHQFEGESTIGDVARALRAL